MSVITGGWFVIIWRGRKEVTRREGGRRENECERRKSRR